MIEHFFTCPYCWEHISMLLDPDMSEESYVEDCQVCCNPMEIHFIMIEGVLRTFEVRKLQ